MLNARLQWINELTEYNPPLVLDKNSAGYTLYIAMDKQGSKLDRPIAFHQTGSGMWETLKALYEMEQERTRRTSKIESIVATP